MHLDSTSSLKARPYAHRHLMLLCVLSLIILAATLFLPVLDHTSSLEAFHHFMVNSGNRDHADHSNHHGQDDEHDPCSCPACHFSAFSYGSLALQTSDFRIRLPLLAVCPETPFHHSRIHVVATASPRAPPTQV